MNPGHKRERSHGGDDASGNEGSKRSKKEMESSNPGVRRGQTQQPCKMFFSRDPGPGLNPRDSFADRKTVMCNMVNTSQGCRFGSKCMFAHGVLELGRPRIDPRFGGRSQQFVASASAQISTDVNFAEVFARNPQQFVASASAQISTDVNFAEVFARNPANSKKICTQTGVKLFIRAHDTDPRQRIIVLEGTLDQMIEAGRLLQQLLSDFSSSTSQGQHPGSSSSSQGATPGYYKRWV